MITPQELAKYFDHTLLRADAQQADFKRLCGEAAQYGFRMVAINSAPVKLCHQLLAGSGVHVGAAISFPLGQTDIEVKAFETELALQKGADEIDYVINLGRLKDGEYAYIEKEMQKIVMLCREHNATSKVIFENCYLTDDEKKRLCAIACKVKPDYIKTSTGFGAGGATLHDVRLMLSEVGGEVKVKAAGGIRSLDTALEFIQLGVRRLGSSASVAIVEDYKKIYQSNEPI